MGQTKGRTRRHNVTRQGNQMTLGSLTHLGIKRSRNQDNFCALAGPNAPPGTDALLAAADGMGGHQAGEVASSLAIQGLTKRLADHGGAEATLPGAHYYSSRLSSVVQEINAEVHKAGGRPDTHGMGTTLTAALVVGPTYVIAHVGDSRAYLLRKGELRRLTQDHSWVGEEMARGALTAHQARQHPKRNILTQALGTEPNVQVEQIEGELQQGDVLLLCSDGLHSLVADEGIARILARDEPQKACDSLVDQANSLGGNDNITAIVARVDRLGEKRGAAGLPSLHRETTVRLGRLPNQRTNVGKAVRMVTLPLWGPLGVIVKLARVVTG